MRHTKLLLTVEFLPEVDSRIGQRDCDETGDDDGANCGHYFHQFCDAEEEETVLLTDHPLTHYGHSDKRTRYTGEAQALNAEQRSAALKDFVARWTPPIGPRADQSERYTSMAGS